MNCGLTLCITCLFRDQPQLDDYIRHDICGWLNHAAYPPTLNPGRVYLGDGVCEYSGAGFRAFCLRVYEEGDLQPFKAPRCDILAVQKEIASLDPYDNYLKTVLLPTLRSPISVQYF